MAGQENQEAITRLIAKIEQDLGKMRECVVGEGAKGFDTYYFRHMEEDFRQLKELGCPRDNLQTLVIKRAIILQKNKEIHEDLMLKGFGSLD